MKQSQSRKGCHFPELQVTIASGRATPTAGLRSTHSSSCCFAFRDLAFLTTTRRQGEGIINATVKVPQNKNIQQVKSDIKTSQAKRDIIRFPQNNQACLLPRNTSENSNMTVVTQAISEKKQQKEPLVTSEVLPESVTDVEGGSSSSSNQRRHAALLVQIQRNRALQAHSLTTTCIFLLALTVFTAGVFASFYVYQSYTQYKVCHFMTLSG